MCTRNVMDLLTARLSSPPSTHTHTHTHTHALQTTKEADDFYQRKVDYVSQNIEKMQKAMMEKHNFREC